MHFFQTKDGLEFTLFHAMILIFALNPCIIRLSKGICTQKLRLDHLERSTPTQEQLHRSNQDPDCRMVVIQSTTHREGLPYNNNQQDRCDRFYG